MVLIIIQSDTKRYKAIQSDTKRYKAIQSDTKRVNYV